MSFGHAALFGTGAYVTAILQVRLGVNPWLAAALAIAAATLVAGFIGALSFRYGLRGSYFALVTLAFAEVLRILASSFEVTGGGQGILVPYKAGIANFQFADRISTYTLVLAMVAVAMLITLAVQRSRFGAYLIAIRENEEAAKALGIDTFRTKVLAMMLSGAIGGAAGVAYLQTYLFIDAPIAYGSTMSIEALLGPIIGGAGTLWGPLVGTLDPASDGESAKHLVGGAPGLNLVLYGVVLLVILRYLPNGIVGLAAPASDDQRCGRRVREGGQPMLTSENVTKRYGGLIAVNDAIADSAARADRRPDRSERRRQDHAVRHDRRASCSRTPARSRFGRGHHRAARPRHLPPRPDADVSDRAALRGL